MPPGFMNAMTGRVAPVDGSSFWLSAIRLPSAKSSPLSAGTLAGVRGRLWFGVSAGAILPSTLFSIGATSVL